ncbi:hypothetical protein AAHC03_09937 [Spirometra sp. Aus1]
MEKRKDAIDRPQKIRKVPKRVSSGTGLLEELNRLLDEVESFEANLHDAISFQVTGAGKVDRSLWRDSLSPPSYEAAVENIQSIRKCINYAADLEELIVDPGPGELLNRLFESLWWIQKICDCNRVLHYDSNLVRSVWRPAFTDRTLSVLQRYLQPSNKAFWSSLGDAWTQPSGKPTMQTGTEFLPPQRTTVIEKTQEFKPEITIRDYGYYKPPPTLSAASSTRESKAPDIEAFINAVHARKGQLVIAKQKNVSEAVRELSVNVGDILEVLDDSGEWCCLRTPTGATGHVPKSCITPLEEDRSGRQRTPSRQGSKSPRIKTASTRKSTTIKESSHKTTSRKDQRMSPSPCSDDEEDSETVTCAHFVEQSSEEDNCRGGGQSSSRRGKRSQGGDSKNQPAQCQPIVQYATPSAFQTVQAQPMTTRGYAQPIIAQTGNPSQPTVLVVPSQSAQGGTGPAIHYLTDDSTYAEVGNSSARKQRILQQIIGHKQPAHMPTLTRELKERMTAMQLGKGNGLLPARRRDINGSWNASNSSAPDPAAEITRLTHQFGTAEN